MTNFNIWLSIIGLTAITVLSRGLFLLGGANIKIPHAAQRALRYAPAAALVALIAPELFTMHDTLSATSLNPAYNPKLLVGIAAGILFFYTRHMLLMIVAGMALYALLIIFNG
jgi:branched-subunit amino acid transport protein